MASNREKETGVGYPQLSREAINLLIDSLVWTMRDRRLGDRADLAENTASALTGFYTRRWGMPPAITGRIERIRELGAGFLADDPAAPIPAEQPQTR